MTQNRPAKLISLLKISFLLLALPALLHAETKNFYFPEVRIEVDVEKDGSFVVDEYRTYDFRGRFSWASLWIPLRVERQGTGYDVGIEDFRITDDQGGALQTETSVKDGNCTAKWHFSAGNERMTFHIHYRVRGGIVSYPDVTELYWRVIGSGWDKPTGKATVNVHLPEAVASKNDIRVYGHGPLSGWAEIVDERTARFTATDIGSRQFLEVRVIWPTGIVGGVPSTRHTLESITREEAAFVQQTIERARRAQEARRRAQRTFFKLAGLWTLWLIVGPIIWLFFYIQYWKRIGKDYRFDDIPQYFRELPSDLPPALVQVLLREGRHVIPSSFTATLFDLARRGFIEIEDRAVEKRKLFGVKQAIESIATLRKDISGNSGLRGYEEDLLGLLFITVGETDGRKGARLSLDDLKDYLKKKPQKFQTWYLAWVKSIKEEAKPLQFIEPESLRARNVFLIVSLPIAILTLNPLLVIIVSVLIPKMKRRAFKWARENEMWKALRRFLDDFSEFKELPPEAYKLWEHYLVFGILFGNAKKIVKMLPTILQDERAVAPVWYYGYNRMVFIGSGGLESMIATIEHVSSSIAQASTSAAHYSSGGGGGFSAGGGGGGGGGGGSAG
jgi:uncharacterized membrane protein